MLFSYGFARGRMQRVKLQGAGGKILKNEGTSRQLCEVYTVLGDAEIPDAERTFRKQRLQRAADLANQDPFANRFFQLAHEIRSLAFLPNMGTPAWHTTANMRAAQILS